MNFILTVEFTQGHDVSTAAVDTEGDDGRTNEYVEQLVAVGRHDEVGGSIEHHFVLNCFLHVRRFHDLHLHELLAVDGHDVKMQSEVVGDHIFR